MLTTQIIAYDSNTADANNTLHDLLATIFLCNSPGSYNMIIIYYFDEAR